MLVLLVFAVFTEFLSRVSVVLSSWICRLLSLVRIYWALEIAVCTKLLCWEFVGRIVAFRVCRVQPSSVCHFIEFCSWVWVQVFGLLLRVPSSSVLENWVFAVCYVLSRQFLESFVAEFLQSESCLRIPSFCSRVVEFDGCVGWVKFSSFWLSPVKLLDCFWVLAAVVN